MMNAQARNNEQIYYIGFNGNGNGLRFAFAPKGSIMVEVNRIAVILFLNVACLSILA